MLILSVIAGVISTTTAIYPYPVVAQEPEEFQEFVLSDGITATDINPLDDPLLDLVHANDGAFEGGLTGTKADARSDLAILSFSRQAALSAMRRAPQLGQIVNFRFAYRLIFNLAGTFRPLRTRIYTGLGH